MYLGQCLINIGAARGCVSVDVEDVFVKRKAVQEFVTSTDKITAIKAELKALIVTNHQFISFTTDIVTEQYNWRVTDFAPRVQKK